MKFRIALIFAFLAFSLPALAEKPRMSEADARAVQTSLDLGQMLYNYDQAAWDATDTLREDVADLFFREGANI